MLVDSFRLVTARLIPQIIRCKQALLLAALILAMSGLAGCGGSSATTAADWRTVAGAGFTFQAPVGWKVDRANGRISVSHDSELVQVSTFPLAKRYDDTLFARVAPELRSRMQEIARETGGKLSDGQTVTAGGVRSHAYDVTAGNQVDQYTFVFTGKREHLLLCRRKSSGGSNFCEQLVTSFVRR
jgi:hypothetical protein